MSRFVDLSPLLPSDLEIRFKEGGETYLVPGSPEVPRMLKWLSFQDRFKDATPEEGMALLTEIYEDLLDLFREYQPALESLPIHQEQVMGVFEALVDAAAGEEQDPPTPRTPPRKRKS